MTDDFLTVEDVARHLKLKPRAVHALLRGGTLMGVKIGSHWRVRPADLEAYEAAIFSNTIVKECKNG